MIMRLRAAAVHLLTATGAAFALLALIAAARGDWQLMFVWLGVALVVDTIDGPLARLVGGCDGLAALERRAS
jgi:phosphatidylcholine synthase